MTTPRLTLRQHTIIRYQTYAAAWHATAIHARDHGQLAIYAQCSGYAAEDYAHARALMGLED